ncbi:MAG TPA: class I SAM-dependent methyltransferase [Gemmatales bacterium]|nr:class I SAM-dependent methyltransferase [Gemmatales bacterium]
MPLYRGVTDRLGHAPGAWGFDRCLRCGSARLTPWPRAEELASFYPPVYSFTTDLGRQSVLKSLLAQVEYQVFYAPQYAAQVRIVCRAMRRTRGQGVRMLDVGCGRGLRLDGFARRGFKVTGADFQPEVIAELKQRGFGGVVSDIDHLSDHFPPGTFDLITAFYVLEHVPDVAATLAQCRRLLRPGGWLAAAVPLGDGLQANVLGRRWIHVGEAPRHLSLPSSRGLESAVRAAGFTAVRIVPDAALNAAGALASSLIPAASLTHAYGGAGGGGALVRRLIGGVVTVLAGPLMWLEGHLLRRPGHGIVMGQAAHPGFAER